MAIRSGLLTRPAQCGRCGGVGEIDAHHHDYQRMLDVEWLCVRCHGKETGSAMSRRPRCIGCGKVIWNHVLDAGGARSVRNHGYAHNACYRLASAMVRRVESIKYLGAERVA